MPSDHAKLKRILSSLSRKEITLHEAMAALKPIIHYEDIGVAKVDHGRTMRQGIPEVILARGKHIDDVAAVAKSMFRQSGKFLITKADKQVYDSLGIKQALFYPRSGVIMAGQGGRKKGKVLIVSAGTADISVAEEAALTASFMGSGTETLYDAGVSCLHRILMNRHLLDGARCVIVVAGMEGALPSVVGALTDKPVVAVPTSVGYGASFGGIAALLAMLNSCAPGIAVMNIDNGFGAGCLAHKINTIA